jgi:hypothetical protein
MTVAQRRVRTVALTAPSESLVRRGATMLADALRIASLPGAAPGRLLVVRSLTVGDIHADASPATLALSIDRRVAKLDAAAVSWEDAGATRASAVVFRDDAEPIVALALRLARRQPVDAWFWPLAVPGWRRAMPPDEAFRMVLAGSLLTRAGPGGLLRLVAELAERDSLDPVLGALRSQDGGELLRALGWTAPAASWPSAPEPAAPIDRSAHHEPGREPATARRAEPLRSLDDAGRSLAPRWTPVVARWVARWSATDARSVWLVAMALAAEQPARLLDHRLPAQAHRVATSLAMRGAALAATSEPTAPYGSTGVATAALTPSQAKAEPASEAPSLEGGADAASGGPATGECALPPREPARVAAAEPPAWRAIAAAESTANAGLFFVIPIMTRLGMAAFLESHPHLVDLDLPRRVLDRLGERLSIAAADPVRAAAGSVPATNDEVFDFVAPARWLTGIAGRDPMIIRQREGKRDSRLLCDRSAVLPLALWRGRAPEAARALAAGSRVCRGRPAAPSSDADVLVTSWLVAIRRWSRRYARIGLAELVRRPGRVAATRTHVDLVFSRRHADVRIRAAGLDVDPGWVPWLGRVLGYHYRDE